MYTFEVMPQSWSKRRKPTEPERQISHFEVLDFEKRDNHQCSVNVTFEDGLTEQMNARVYVNRTHFIKEDGSLAYKDNSWGVQAINPQGVSLVLRLVE